MAIPTDDQDRAEVFRSTAQRIILEWMRNCSIKTPMSDMPDVLANLTDAVMHELERTYQGAKSGA